MQLLKWLFLDLNSYFASVEQELRPELRSKPVGVVPVMADTTCCIAASYEAKAFGVKTGTMVADAKRLCRDIQLVEARHEVYVHYHNKIVEAIDTCLPIAAVVSIDEMACELTGSQQVVENAVALSKKIKTKIRENVGSTLRCSIGLAPNRFLAKVGSDMQKPDGLTVIQQTDLPDILYTLQTNDFPGIGRRMERRLKKHGVDTSKQLLGLSKSEMQTIWGGIVGERFWRLLRGEDLAELHTERRTVGHSHVLSPNMRTIERAFLVSQKLVHKAAARLRRLHYWTCRLSVYVRFMDKTSWGDEVCMIECQDTLTMLEGLQLLWKNIPSKKPLAVGVTLSHLIPDNLHDFSFFDEAKRTRLAKAMDKLNYKYGANLVHFGDMELVKAAAPTRIAFTSIPDLEDLDPHFVLKRGQGEVSGQ
ncbi:MAG: DNA polymerase [Ignavibacteriae bacterium]|nr:DNA polymerase [Ignavibacteria bacterium]MBI3364539.1 DNA polymerase [Ignavibacteriota bacterium]